MLVFCQEGAGTAFVAIAKVFMKLGAWDSRMLKAVAAGMGVEAVLQIGAELLANPIALFDSHQGLICYAGDMPREVAGTIWDVVLIKGFTPIEFFTHEEQRSIATLLKGRWPFVLTAERAPDHENLSTVVTMNGELVGTLGQVDVSAPFTPGQIALADLVRERARRRLLDLSGAAAHVPRGLRHAPDGEGRRHPEHGARRRCRRSVFVHLYHLPQR